MTYDSIQSILAQILIKLQNGYELLREGHYTVIWMEFLKRLYSTSLSVGLRRDISEDFENPNARIDISIRKLKNSDTRIILEHGKFAKANPRLAEYQQNLVEADLPDCYVAVTEYNEPCYMQWLIGPEHNERLSELFGNSFPQLKKDEALLEAAFMRPAFRGKRIMPAAMSRITRKAKDMEGIRYVHTFVDIQNIPSLKGCKRAGFSPYIMREDRWFLFRRKITFASLPNEVISQYKTAISK
ncbi:MAG: GNAT family N-acetyltransferase [Balneolaceae bacterium]